MLPTVELKGEEITRLIIGGNPFSGNSHISREKDEEMMDYFTTEKIKETLFRCEEAGLNTAQMRGDQHIMRILREYYNEGGKLKWIAQTASEMRSFSGNVRQIMKMEPAAIYHHGSVTDSLFKAGKYDELKERLDILLETGKPVGLGTHMPEVIEYAEDNEWGMDFYMTSVHNLSREDRVSSAITGRSNTGERFEDEDRAVMYEMIRAVDKPCLVFKILSAGRKCDSEEEVREAFQEALSEIKPNDALVVGMFTKYKDQVSENARLVAEIAGD